MSSIWRILKNAVVFVEMNSKNVKGRDGSNLLYGTIYLTWSKGFLNFKNVVCLGQRLKIKGFRSRVGFGQVKGSVLKILRIKGWHPYLHGLAPLHVFKVFWYPRLLMIDFWISSSKSACCLLDMDDTESLHFSLSYNALVPPLMPLLLLRCPHHICIGW